jgi:hypothetical protein
VLARHAPQMARQVGLLRLHHPLRDPLIELVEGLLVARPDLPAQPVAAPPDVDLGALAEALDLIAQVAFDDAPHRLQAELGERRFGFADRLAGQGEGKAALVPLVVAPAIGQQFVAAARHPLEIELLRLDGRHQHDQRGKDRAAEPHVTDP